MLSLQREAAWAKERVLGHLRQFRKIKVDNRNYPLIRIEGYSELQSRYRTGSLQSSLLKPSFTECLLFTGSVSRRGGRNKGGRKQMRANANKRRQTLTNASKRRGKNASKRKQTQAKASKRGQTQTNAYTPPLLWFLTPPFAIPYRESPRQTKPKKGPKRNVHEFRPFCEFWCFSLGKKHDSHQTFVPECPQEKFMNWPFFGLVCRGDS